MVRFRGSVAHTLMRRYVFDEFLWLILRFHWELVPCFRQVGMSKWILGQPEIDRFQGSWVASLEFWIWFVLNFVSFKSLQLKCLFDWFICWHSALKVWWSKMFCCGWKGAFFVVDSASGSLWLRSLWNLGFVSIVFVRNLFKSLHFYGGLLWIHS